MGHLYHGYVTNNQVWYISQLKKSGKRFLTPTVLEVDLKNFSASLFMEYELRNDAPKQGYVFL